MIFDATGNEMDDRERTRERYTFLLKLLSQYGLRAQDSRAPDRMINKGITLGAFSSREEAERLIASARSAAGRVKVTWREGSGGIPRDLTSAEDVKAEIDRIVKKQKRRQNALSAIGPILVVALANGAWRTQTEAAAALNLSRADVQVAVAIGRLPMSVRDCFGAGELRAPVLRRLHALARQHGWEKLEENASRCLSPEDGRRRSVGEVMAMLSTDQSMSASNKT